MKNAKIKKWISLNYFKFNIGIHKFLWTVFEKADYQLKTVNHILIAGKMKAFVRLHSLWKIIDFN